MSRTNAYCRIVRERIAEAVERDVIGRYEAGERVADIAAATGVAMSSVYPILRRHGLTPDRKQRSSASARVEDALRLALELLDEDDRARVLAVLNGDG